MSPSVSVTPFSFIADVFNQKWNLCLRAESQKPQVLALVPQALSNHSQILSAEQGTDVFNVS